jgi:predicted DNA-binding protein (MmcQ/YjbR family)
MMAQKIILLAFFALMQLFPSSANATVNEYTLYECKLGVHRIYVDVIDPKSNQYTVRYLDEEQKTRYEGKGTFTSEKYRSHSLYPASNKFSFTKSKAEYIHLEFALSPGRNKLFYARINAKMINSNVAGGFSNLKDWPMYCDRKFNLNDWDEHLQQTLREKNELNINELSIQVMATTNPKTSDESVTNFKSIFSETSLSVLGKGVMDENTDEIIAFVCLEKNKDGQCAKAQASSTIKGSLFLFGSVYDLTQTQQVVPSIFLDQRGWSWSVLPQRLNSKNFYAMKERISKRNLQQFEENFKSNHFATDHWYSIGARGCFSDVQIDLEPIRTSQLTYDAQVQAADLISQKYRCKVKGETLRISLTVHETLGKLKSKVYEKNHWQQGPSGTYAYPPQLWYVAITTHSPESLDALTKKQAFSKLWRGNQRENQMAFRAHQLLFSLADEADQW